MDLSSVKYDPKKNKSVVFFSGGSPRDCSLFLDAGIYEMLVSYFYLRKRLSAFNDILDIVRDNGGLFMTDSGGFSFITAGKRDGHVEEYYDPEYWKPYLEEYVGWLNDNHKRVFVAANLDLDMYVGRDVVDEWNERYFEPLLKKMNIVFVSQPDISSPDSGLGALPRFKDYCSRYKYVGIPGIFLRHAHTVYQHAKINGNILHGFGWTSMPLLAKYPLFSVDSTTWVGGTKYGTSYMYDGKNFRIKDYKQKHLRKSDKVFCLENGIDYEGFMAEKQRPVHRYSLLNWKGAVIEYLKIANIKLVNKTVHSYIR